MRNHFFRDRDGQTPLPSELLKGLKHPHIQTMGELDEFEEQNIAEGLAWLEHCEEECLSYKFWLKLHKKLFGEVWDWAGKTREHELQNSQFLSWHQIWPAFKQLEQDVAYWLEKKSFPFKEIAARFHERIETIHPFANGNGRFGRILVEFFCKQNGAEVPVWGASMRDDPRVRRKAYIAALEKARSERDYNLLVEYMFK